MTNKVVRMALVLLTIAGSVFANLASNDGPGPDPEPAGPKSSYPANVQPAFAAPYSCGQPGAATLSVMQKLNAFWESGVRACACQSDAPAICNQNAFVSQQTYGYIFYDRNFLDTLDRSSGSSLPADFFMAHEFGHNVQLRLGLANPNLPSRVVELQADCLGGFYVGFQIRSGNVRQTDYLNAFSFACQIGDPVQLPWWAPGSHGSCGDRVSSLNRGIQGYQQGLLPGQACG